LCQSFLRRAAGVGGPRQAKEFAMSHKCAEQCLWSLSSYACTAEFEPKLASYFTQSLYLYI